MLIFNLFTSLYIVRVHIWWRFALTTDFTLIPQFFFFVFFYFLTLTTRTTHVCHGILDVLHDFYFKMITCLEWKVKQEKKIIITKTTTTIMKKENTKQARCEQQFILNWNKLFAATALTCAQCIFSYLYKFSFDINVYVFHLFLYIIYFWFASVKM